MSFSANKMDIFSRRIQNLVLALQDVREEGARLDAIYTNETVSGTDPAYDDTTIATASEHTDIINLIRDLDKFFTNQAVSQADRQTNLSPFTQDVPT
jgi:hypothetical protein